MNGLNIAVVGAGIGGLTAAAALAETGNAVTLFDQFKRPRPIGSGLIIQPVGQAVLDLIGVLPEVLDQGATLLGMEGYDISRRWPVLNVEYDPTSTTGNKGIGIHRATLFDILLKQAQAKGVKFLTGHKVVGINNYQTRKLRFEGDQESDVYDLVVNAAGTNSPISPLKAKPVAYGAVWGNVDWPAETELAPNALSQRYDKAEKMVGILPIGRMPGETTQKAAVFWSIKREALEGWRATPWPDCRAEIIKLWPAAEPFFMQVKTHDALTEAFYAHGAVRRMSAPGLVHIGDAAHSTSPQLGQGANMALLDAYALSLALESSESLPRALKAFGKIRGRHIQTYQTLSRLFTPLYQSDKAAVAHLRDYLLAPLAMVPPMPKLLSKIVCGDVVKPLKDGVIG